MVKILPLNLVLVAPRALLEEVGQPSTKNACQQKPHDKQHDGVVRHQPPPVWSLAGDTRLVRTNHFGKLPVSSISRIPRLEVHAEGPLGAPIIAQRQGMGWRSRPESGRGSSSCCRLP